MQKFGGINKKELILKLRELFRKLKDKKTKNEDQILEEK